MDPSFKIREMTVEDLKEVTKWANEEGWNFSDYDTEALFNADPKGYFVGEANGELVGSFAAVKYGDLCFWTLYIVRGKFRGSGYGSKIFEHARNYCKDSKSMALDATGQHINNYMRYGFKSYCQIISYKKEAQGKLGPNVVDIHKVPIEKILEYDLSVFGYPRRRFLELLLEQRNMYGLAVMEDDKVIGYGIIRKSTSGYLVGPLSADNSEIANELYESLQSFIPGQTILTEVFDINADAMEIMEKQGWIHSWTFTRMYARAPPKMDMTKLYAPVDEIS